MQQVIGARMTLLNKDKRREADERARWVEFVEIATEPAFEKEFMQAMHIPHMKDKFPNLKALLEEQKAPIALIHKRIDGRKRGMSFCRFLRAMGSQGTISPPGNPSPLHSVARRKVMEEQ